ncbi:MAG: hypothetical protein IH840_11600, partial [Candidatus Heimdallarchaeota archaeon]|nr:hypothetical protein [Candidatus Heimdallarchaeota archaeon]
MTLRSKSSWSPEDKIKIDKTITDIIVANESEWSVAVNIKRKDFIVILGKLGKIASAAVPFLIDYVESTP